MEFSLKLLPLPVRMRLFAPMNDETLLRFCAANDDLRIEREADGEILVMAPTGSDGGATEFEIGAQLFLWARADGRGKMFGPSSGFRLPDTSMKSPDASWISYPRWNRLTRRQQQGFAPICPEFVIEVLSKSDSLLRLKAKMKMWIANGAELAWLIDPERGMVVMYRQGQSPEVHYQPSSVNGSGPVTGFVLVLD